MSTSTVNKTIDFEKLLPDFKRFAAKKNTWRKVLKCIYFDGHHLVVTDSHRLIRINAAYVKNLPSNDPFLYDVYEKQIITSESKYPDVNKLIPNHFNTESTMNYNQFKAMRNSVNDLLKSVEKVVNHVISLDFTNHALTLSDRKELSISHDINKAGEDIKLYVNGKYLKDALMVANKLRGLSNDEIEINTVGKLRPMTIKQGDVFDIIILPVRIY